MNIHSLVAVYCKNPKNVSQLISDMIFLSDAQSKQKLGDTTEYTVVSQNFGIGAINLGQNTENNIIQPLEDEQNKLSIVFDGEIYNKAFFEEYLINYSMENTDFELITQLIKKLISSFKSSTCIFL